MRTNPKILLLTVLGPLAVIVTLAAVAEHPLPSGTCESTPPPPASAELAAEHYRRAVLLLHTPNAPTRDLLEGVVEGGWPEDDGVVSHYLRAHREALDELLRATEYERCAFEQDDDFTFATWSNLARLVLVEARRAEGGGDPRAALGRYLTLLRMANHCRQEPQGNVAAGIIAGSLELRAQPRVAELTASAPAAELRDLLRELNHLRATRTSLATAYRTDRAQLEKLLIGEWRLDMDPDDLRRVVARYRALDGKLTEAFEVACERADPSSYLERLAELEQEVEDALAGTGPANDEERVDLAIRTVLFVSLDVMAQQIDADLAQQARTDLLRVAVALRLFAAERGALPDSLEPLVPDYLEALPADPFGSGRPLGWTVTDGGGRLHSIGPDRACQGGVVEHAPRDPEAGGDLVLELEDTPR